MSSVFARLRFAVQQPFRLVWLQFMSMRGPLGLALILVGCLVLYDPAPERRRPKPPPSCEALADAFQSRFRRQAWDRLGLAERAALSAEIPVPCQQAWSLEPPSSWALARLDRRPRPRYAPFSWPDPPPYPMPLPARMPGLTLAPDPNA
jgi:hypothetical protein